MIINGILLSKLLTFCLILIFVQIARGQTFTSTVTGIISDTNQAIIANATVTVINQATKLTFTTQTNDSGNYTITFLPIGEYIISIEAKGFKKVVSNPIKLEVNQNARVNLNLSVGEISETVMIANVVPLIQTETASVGTVISRNTIDSLPLNGRNFQSLVLLVPGAVTPAVTSFTQLSPGIYESRPFVNGNREQTNAFLVDGISVDETIDNRIGLKPTIDSIAEFEVETSNSSAEFGNVAGATVNVSTKSGTNNFHGNIFEFFRNDALDANLWRNNRFDIPKQKLRQNIYGGTFGGPIVKNKAFFFLSYQGINQKTGGGVTNAVAPLAWRKGDFSDIADPILDPLTGLQFPGNQIPVSRFSATAKALFANPNLYPLPNSNDDLSEYVSTFSQTLSSNQFDLKLDFRPNEKNSISGRYSFALQAETGIQGGLPTDLTDLRQGKPQNFVVNYSRSFTSVLINETRFGYNRAIFSNDGFDWAKIGNANSKLGISQTQAIPGLSAISISGLSQIGSYAITEFNKTSTWLIANNLTTIRGNQTIKIGGQFQRYIQNRFSPGNSGLLGFFKYRDNFTGFAFADFLLDNVTSKGIGSASEGWTHLQNRIGIFAQNDWKVKYNLTLNLGIRWEFSSPIVEKDDKQVNFDLKTGAMLFAGQNGNSRALYQPYYTGFEPRLGLAWTPKVADNKLVLRAGYGIIQFMEGTGANLRLPLNPPFFAEGFIRYDSSCATTTCNPNDPNRSNRISNGFAGLILQDKPSGVIRIWSPNLRPQFTQQINLTGEYQLFRNTTFSISYVGHIATHLVAPTDWNQPLPGLGDPSTWADSQTRRPFYSIYPDVTEIGGTDSWAKSNHNSLQTVLRYRYHNGLEFLASYTFGKTLTDNLGFYGSGVFSGDQGFYPSNSYNREAEYGLAFFDVKHNFNFSGSYELPIGENKLFGKKLNSIANSFLSGWNIATVVNFKSGFPITVYDTRITETSLQAPRDGAFPRPNRIGSGVPTNQTVNNWINAADFISPDLGKFGNSGVGILRGPDFKQIDLSLGKKFYFAETKYLDFRTEFFNFTNHPNFSLPGRDLADDGDFGVITKTVNESRRIEFVLKFYF